MPKYFLVFCLLINGCTTQVHLITQGYTSIQTANITDKINNSGFSVANSTINIPSHYPSSVLALNPAHTAHQDIPKLQQILNELGYNTAEVLRFGTNKHFYNNGHIGLYLRHPSINPNSLMPPYIESVQCSSGYATLGFNANQKMHLETGKNINGELELFIQHGQWSFNGTLLSITLPGQPLATFRKTDVTRDTALGFRPALLYAPQQNNHIISALNCNFEVIFMD